MKLFCVSKLTPSYYVYYFGGRHIAFVLSVRHTVCQRNSSETTEQNFMKLGR
jgi:hypothetical protein